MNQDVQTQLDSLKKQVDELKRISIQLNIEPTTRLYLTKVISEETSATIASQVAAAVALLPTQTYSASSPSGSAPAGSLWMKDTGVLATNEIHVYSGSAWIRMK